MPYLKPLFPGEDTTTWCAFAPVAYCRACRRVVTPRDVKRLGCCPSCEPEPKMQPTP